MRLPNSLDPHDDGAGFLAVRLMVAAACAVILWGGILLYSL